MENTFISNPVFGGQLKAHITIVNHIQNRTLIFILCLLYFDKTINFHILIFGANTKRNQVAEKKHKSYILLLNNIIFYFDRKHREYRDRKEFPYLKYYIIVIPQSYQTFLSKL